jgi:hypothetical protein
VLRRSSPRVRGFRRSVSLGKFRARFTAAIITAPPAAPARRYWRLFLWTVASCATYFEITLGIPGRTGRIRPRLHSHHS